MIALAIMGQLILAVLVAVVVLLAGSPGRPLIMMPGHARPFSGVPLRPVPEPTAAAMALSVVRQHGDAHTASGFCPPGAKDADPVPEHSRWPACPVAYVRCP
jgi:hypothetical protein